MQVHPSLITPAEPFDIFYFLRNPVDTATYYIKAVIYDVRSGEQLTTVTLTQSSVNAHLFVATLQAPPDPSAMGRNIVAIASVYTDSGYTTKSDAYEEQESYFLVKAVLPFAGGGSVDYRTVREIVAEELDKRPQLTPTALPEMPFEAVFGALGALQREVNRIPKEQADNSPVLAAIVTVKQVIAALPKPSAVDLTPVLNEIQASRRSVLEAIADIPGPMLDGIEEALDSLKRTAKAMGDGLHAAIDSTFKREMGKKEFKITMNALPEPSATSQPSPIDLSHLMS